MDRYDYPAAASVWQRVNPGEDPYPDAGKNEAAIAPVMHDVPAVPQDGLRTLYRALLQEEVRHLHQVLAVVEKTLA